jgi:hypothetical protein
MSFDFLNRFRRSAPTPPMPEPSGGRLPRFSRTSSGLKEFSNCLASEEQRAILDLGPTSSVNLMRFTGMGHKVYSEDLLLAAQDPGVYELDDHGAREVSVEKFFAQNMRFSQDQFDAILAWDIADYLPEPLVKPWVERLHAVTQKGAMVLAFFHTRDAGPDVPYHRYHIQGNDLLELEALPRYRLQRIFNNRNIENLFRDFSSVKFFLARDFIREVLIVR